MITYKRIVVKDWSISDKEGNTLSLKRGEEYITSRTEKGKCCVFSNYWVWVPAKLFTAAVRFT